MTGPRSAAAAADLGGSGAPPRPAGTGCAHDSWSGAEGPPWAFVHGLRAADLPAGSVDPLPVTEADLAHLPRQAQRYLRFMGVIGRPRDWSLRAHLTGRFRLTADGEWAPCEAWQYSWGGEPARLFRMRMTVKGVPMTGWDTYLRGRGRMRGTVLGLVPVVRGSGPRFDTSELVTWLNDAVLMAPSMLLGPGTTWSAGPDDRSFDVALTDRGRTVSARVLLGPNGAPREFWTDDRYADLPGGLVRARWRTPVEGWTEVDGRPRMTGASAIWELCGGPFRYAELSPVTVEYNIPLP
ncbi:DUF6544 family protein [Pseudonocardia zijingensis]